MAEINYKGEVKTMPEPYAGVLVKIGRATYANRQIKPDPEPAAEAEEISPRTGKPKRKYERRDMKAKD